MADVKSNYQVRLISVVSNRNGGSFRPEEVNFDVTPTFSESRSVDYSSVTPVHMPGGIQVYKHTNSRTFTIGAHFISRTVAEATQNMRNLQTLRGWTMPYFGTSTLSSSDIESRRQAVDNQTSTNQINQAGDQQLSPEERARSAQDRISKYGIELLGAPPDVLYLYAYSSSNVGAGGLSDGSRLVSYGVNINKVPVVLTGLDITYPDDVDYLPTSSGNDANGTPIIDPFNDPFPIKMDVSITVVETHSPREYERFDLKKYKQGLLANF